MGPTRTTVARQAAAVSEAMEGALAIISGGASSYGDLDRELQLGSERELELSNERELEPTPALLACGEGPVSVIEGGASKPSSVVHFERPRIVHRL